MHQWSTNGLLFFNIELQNLNLPVKKGRDLMISDAVSLNRVSRIVGYKIAKGNFAPTSPNLPQNIALLSEANDANQAGLNTSSPTVITSAKQAGQLFGFGSPIYLAARILMPLNGGGGINGVPLSVFPQAKAPGATPQNFALSVSGVANKNGTHNLIIAGRESVDGEDYEIQINAGDTASDIYATITDAVNSILGCPVTANDTDYAVGFTTKWSGLTAAGVSIGIDTGSDTLGLTYTISTESSGTGTPSIEAALEQFGNVWFTQVINSYGTDADTMAALENANGIPDPTNPTGNFVGIIMKPFVALTGSTLEDPSDITNADTLNVTIAICPAPLSKGLPLEAAANMSVLFTNIAQNTPHLDVAGLSYPDMPTPLNIGSMSAYNNRDAIVQKGCSTVDLVNGVYVVQDFVTTYHPLGENPPQFRYVRSLYQQDFNIYFTFYLLEQLYVLGKVIAADDAIVSVSDVIKPKSWKAILSGTQFSAGLESRGLIVNQDFLNASIDVEVSTTNPDRLETTFSYQRSGIARIVSTTATAGFGFGNPTS